MEAELASDKALVTACAVGLSYLASSAVARFARHKPAVRTHHSWAVLCIIAVRNIQQARQRDKRGNVARATLGPWDNRENATDTYMRKALYNVTTGPSRYTPMPMFVPTGSWEYPAVHGKRNARDTSACTYYTTVCGLVGLTLDGTLANRWVWRL